MTYAANTTVSPEKSRAEIERTLVRYGATGFLYGWQEGGAVVCFAMHGRKIKFLLPFPAMDDDAIARTPGGDRRSASATQVAYDKAIRQRWRALVLCIKSKLETVESGITEFDSRQDKT